MEFELFETVRVENRKAIFIDRHYERIQRSAIILKIPFNLPKEDFKTLIEDAAPESGNYLVKFTLSYSGKTSISFRECQIPGEISLMFSDRIKRKNDFLSRHKTSSIYESIIAVQAAREKGFTEVILSDTKGFISETAFANIFFVKNGVFFTPSLETGCLPGTRRAIVLEILKEMNVPVFEGFFTKEKILKADEVLITSTRYDVVSVHRIEDKNFNLAGKTWGERLKKVMDLIKFK
ncbi:MULTISPECIES: aminotransferase class IV [unclassified Desulfurobacterium]|uniref:aminotransferase class IV n=1 Tax=unclassified Desulfurobacterium TaxID=2639089 RepID=UPI0003B36440|nr:MULTISPECIES: aminotransferase class IV [unclassified Desulfurobacterium]